MGYDSKSYKTLTEGDVSAVCYKDARIAELEQTVRDIAGSNLDLILRHNERVDECDAFKARVEELEAALSFPNYSTLTGGSFGVSVSEQLEDEVEDNARLYRLTNSLRRERDSLKARVEELETELTIERASHSSDAARVEELEAENKTLTGTNVRLNMEQWDLKDERDELRAECEAWSNTNFDLVRQLAEARGQVKEMYDEVLEFSGLLDEANEKLAAALKDASDWEDSWNIAVRKSMELEKQLAEANERLAHMTLNRDYLSNEVREWKADYEKLAAQKPAEPTTYTRFTVQTYLAGKLIRTETYEPINQGDEK